MFETVLSEAVFGPFPLICVFLRPIAFRATTFGKVREVGIQRSGCPHIRSKQMTFEASRWQLGLERQFLSTMPALILCPARSDTTLLQMATEEYLRNPPGNQLENAWSGQLYTTVSRKNDLILLLNQKILPLTPQIH